MSDKKVATIRKWVSQQGWGIANAPYCGAEIPKRYFVHFSKAISDDVKQKLGLGIRILFIEGPARHQSELPVALEIEIAPTQLPAPEKGEGRVQ